MNNHFLLNLDTSGKFWDIQKVLSYNCFLNICVGARNPGKTTQTSIFVTKQCEDEEKDIQFLWLRRTKNEVKRTYKTLISRIYDNSYIKPIGNTQYSYIKLDTNKVIGMIMPVTQAISAKSAVFDKVKYVIYDEAILKRHGNIRYLTNEVTDFLDFLFTTFRLRKNVRVFILGNNLDLISPYHEYFNIPNFKGEFYIDRERSILVQHANLSEELKEEAKESPLYKLTKGTPYGDYAFEGKLLTDTKHDFNNLHNLKVGNILFNFTFNNKTLIIHDTSGFHFYAVFKDKAIENNLTINIIKNNKPNFLQIRIARNNPSIRFLIQSFFKDMIIYKDENALSLMEELIEYVK